MKNLQKIYTRTIQFTSSCFFECILERNNRTDQCYLTIIENYPNLGSIQLIFNKTKFENKMDAIKRINKYEESLYNHN